jgi:hypothetical protein
MKFIHRLSPRQLPAIVREQALQYESGGERDNCEATVRARYVTAHAL